MSLRDRDMTLVITPSLLLVKDNNVLSFSIIEIER